MQNYEKPMMELLVMELGNTDIVCLSGLNNGGNDDNDNTWT